MPGGMGRRGGHEPPGPPDGLNAFTQLQKSVAGLAEEGKSRDERLQRRHCWVVGPADDPGPWPGLITRWEKVEDQWFARAVYLAEAPRLGLAFAAPAPKGPAGSEFMIVERWLPAAYLYPASGAPRRP